MSCSREGQGPRFSCLSLEPQGTSQVTPSLWARQNSAGLSLEMAANHSLGTNTLNKELKQSTVFSIKAQISCLPDQVLMNATVPARRGGQAGELGAEAFHVPQSGQGRGQDDKGALCWSSQLLGKWG